jgi:hypothetical protein
MVSTVLAMLLMAPSPEAVALARRDYSRCLSEFMKKSVKENMTPDAFDAALTPACAAKEQVLRTTIVAVDMAAKIKRAEAEENAGFEVDDLQANIKEVFRDSVKPQT